MTFDGDNFLVVFVADKTVENLRWEQTINQKRSVVVRDSLRADIFIETEYTT